MPAITHTVCVDTICLTSENDYLGFDSFVRSHPRGSLWQSLAWKSYQEALGREVRVYAAREGDLWFAGALVVIDRTALNFSTWEMPRGPLWLEGHEKALKEVLQRILDDAREERCLHVYLSSMAALSLGKIWSESRRFIQPEATIVVDVTAEDEQILAQMKPKGRYNIALAERHGVQVSESRDIDAFYGLLRDTADRDRFATHPPAHYKVFLDALPGSFLLLSTCATEKAQKPIAGLLGVIWGTTGYYYYGASAYAYRALMAPYLLQWAAMRLCKARGCTGYDLLGVAPPGAGEGHPWRGITAFKEKFGGRFMEYPTELQCTLRPVASFVLRAKRRVFG